MERLEDVAIIFRRLLEGRAELTRLNVELSAIRPRNWHQRSGPLPEPEARLSSAGLRVMQEMKVDYESLFHFGSVLLDQWAYASGYLAGVNDPDEFTFHNLVRAVEQPRVPAALAPLRQQLLGHLRWLHFWMRTYRNAFVVHADRPWQRGTTARAQGDTFSLHTPSPPGWEDDAAVNAAILELLPHAPAWLQQMPPDYWERDRPRAFLGRVIENIGTVDEQADRDRIAHLARRAGLNTPTFQVVASVLVDFVARGTTIVRDAALANPATIKLGRAGD